MKKENGIKKIIPNILCFTISFLPLQFGMTILKLAIENNDRPKGEIAKAFLVFGIMTEMVIIGMTIGLAIILAVIAFKSLKKIKQDKKLYVRIVTLEATLYVVIVIVEMLLG